MTSNPDVSARLFREVIDDRSRTLQWLIGALESELSNPTAATSVHAWALDFDCIYPFLAQQSHTSDTLRRLQLLDVVCKEKDVQFVLPPGTLHEITDFCSRLISPYAFVSSGRDLLTKLKLRADEFPVVATNGGDRLSEVLLDATA